jgi:hypothetical protein
VAEKHILGGRVFLPMKELTVGQHYRLMSYLKRARIDGFVKQPGETIPEFADRILGAVLASGDILPILGCLLIPEDAVPVGTGVQPEDAWDDSVAEETARWIGKLKSETDKAKIQCYVISLLGFFFTTGIVSLWSSPTSSASETPSRSGPAGTPGDTGIGNPS